MTADRLYLLNLQKNTWMNSPGLFFRSMESQDIRLVASMMRAFYLIDGYPFDKGIAEENLRIFLNNESLGRLWLILVDEQVIGYLVLTFGFSFEFRGRDAFLDELYIADPYRSSGYGTKAVDFAAEQAKQLGIKALHLEVEHHNEKAKAVYNKSGFKAHDRILMTKMVLST